MSSTTGRPPTPRRRASTNEALLRLLFADQASPAELVRALQRLREDVVARHDEGAAQIEPYLHGEGPFPERAHLVALFADLYRRVFTAYEGWAEEAAAEVASWPTTQRRGMSRAARAQIERATRSVPARRAPR